MMNESDENKLYCNIILSILTECKNRKKAKKEFSDVYFNSSSSLQILDKVSSILKEEPAVLQINTKSKRLDFVIVGDIHGSIESLVNIFKEKGYPPNTRYLFLGDYVDRGTRSCEVITLLYALKCLYPKDIFLMRGNHEFKRICDNYGFKNECLKRIKANYIDDFGENASKFYKKVIETFSMLPICAILDDSIFCVHGGVTSLVQNREELLNLHKVGDRFQKADSAQVEMLWNDPDKFTATYNTSKRGKGSIFGERAVETFLQNMNFKLVIRGHQNVSNGFDWPFGQKGGILTVFSAIDYCNSANKGGIAVILKETDIENLQLVSAHQLSKVSKSNEINNSFSSPLDIYEESY